MLTDDGRRKTDAGDYHSISSPGAFGSGELKMITLFKKIYFGESCEPYFLNSDHAILILKGKSLDKR